MTAAAPAALLAAAPSCLLPVFSQIAIVTVVPLPTMLTDAGRICVHVRQRYTCKECGGRGICEHGRHRRFCKDCGGGPAALLAAVLEALAAMLAHGGPAAHLAVVVLEAMLARCPPAARCGGARCGCCRLMSGGASRGTTLPSAQWGPVPGVPARPPWRRIKHQVGRRGPHIETHSQCLSRIPPLIQQQHRAATPHAAQVPGVEGGTGCGRREQHACTGAALCVPAVPPCLHCQTCLRTRPLSFFPFPSPLLPPSNSCVCATHNIHNAPVSRPMQLCHAGIGGV